MATERETEENEQFSMTMVKELLGLIGDEFAGLGLDDKAIEGLRDMLQSKGELNILKEDGTSAVLEGAQAEAAMQAIDGARMEQLKKEQKERAEAQRKLLLEPGSGPQAGQSKNKDTQRIDSLTQLCQIHIKGYSERVLRLSEVFLPPPNNPFRACMDAYNRDKMPSLRSSLDQK